MRSSKADKANSKSRFEIAHPAFVSCQSITECPRISPAGNGDLDAVRATFSRALAMQMVQGWVDKPEEKFRPGCVRVGWWEDRLLVFAELDDEILYTTANADNQYLWALGDVFEMFLRDEEGDSYAEFHVAPNGHRMQLLYPNAEMNYRIGRGEARLEDVMVKPTLFDFILWKETRKWSIFASVPISVLLPARTSLEGRIWRVSFSRYDYSSADEQPVLSSTSLHRVLSFHRQEEWASVRFST